MENRGNQARREARSGRTRAEGIGPPINRELSLGLSTPSWKKLHVTKPQEYEAGRTSRRKGKRKKDLRIGTWNVRSLYRPDALNILLHTLDNYKISTTALQEIRWTSNGIIERRKHTIFYSFHEKYHVDEVEFVVSSQLKHFIIGFESISSRIGRLRLRRRFYNYSFINCHAPTEDKNRQEKETFYEKLERAYRQCPRNDAKIILEDTNAKIGQEELYRLAIGKYSLHKDNDNGVRLINMAT